MLIRKAQTTPPVDRRPFPDENTVAEMYCNEAYAVDNESVEDWTSSLQMLLTFAAIFSAVLVTLIVDSKSLLKQDSTDVLVDAVIFLMNDLANGTHRPYTPPKFQPSARSMLVNCFFVASLCLSIATALGAVLAMQWVTDYSAVTGRAGSTPEERVKRRHFRYQGSQDWNMDTIIGALPLALHLSVLLFFVGSTVWMWDVHRSIFGVVVLCGVLAVLFYIATTTLAIFCPSCPYRTPLASWIYVLFHLVVTFSGRLFRLTKLEAGSEGSEAKLEVGAAAKTSIFQQFMVGIYLRFSQPSLGSRDDAYIRSPDKALMRNSLIWLSNHIPISSDVYTRLLTLINEFASVVDNSAGSPVRTHVPWMSIFHALGVVYQSFVQNFDLDEDAFADFAQQTHCLSQPGLREILESFSRDKQTQASDGENPVRLIRAWTRSTSLHTSDALRRQRFSDEVMIQDLISSISATPQDLLDTWFALLENEAATCTDILPKLLKRLYGSLGEKSEQRLDATLFLISTGRLPWGSNVRVNCDGGWDWRDFPCSPAVRRLRALDWVESLDSQPQKAVVLEHLSEFKRWNSLRVLLARNIPTDKEDAALKQMGITDLSRWTRMEERLYVALITFDRILNKEYEEESTSKLDMMRWMTEILCEDLMDPAVSLDPTYFRDKTRRFQAQELKDLSNSSLQLFACLLGIESPHRQLPDFPAEEIEGSQHSLTWYNTWGHTWYNVSRVFFRDPSIIDGDGTVLWRLRLQQWSHFDDNIAFNYLSKTLSDLNKLILQKGIEQELKRTRLGIDQEGDFILALIHLNCAYRWHGSVSWLSGFIPDILVGDATYPDRVASNDCIEYLSSICHEINADPARLIRLLTELIRADINYELPSRNPQIFFNLLRHAKSNLSSKKLRSFSSSCQRLALYVTESYNQFVREWDEITSGRTPRRSSSVVVDKQELDMVYKEVLTILEPTTDPWEGETKDISWPRYLLRPTGTRENPFTEDTEPGAVEHQIAWGCVITTGNGGGDGNDEEGRSDHESIDW